jgi:hypothetical protein
LNISFPKIEGPNWDFSEKIQFPLVSGLWFLVSGFRFQVSGGTWGLGDISDWVQSSKWKVESGWCFLFVILVWGEWLNLRILFFCFPTGWGLFLFYGQRQSFSGKEMILLFST